MSSRRQIFQAGKLLNINAVTQELKKITEQASQLSNIFSISGFPEASYQWG